MLTSVLVVAKKNVNTGVRNSEPVLPMPPTASTCILALILMSIAASLLVKEAALFIRIRTLSLGSYLQAGRFWDPGNIRVGMLNIVTTDNRVNSQLRVNTLFL